MMMQRQPTFEEQMRMDLGHQETQREIWRPELEQLIRLRAARDIEWKLYTNSIEHNEQMDRERQRQEMTGERERLAREATVAAQADRQERWQETSGRVLQKQWGLPALPTDMREAQTMKAFMNTEVRAKTETERMKAQQTLVGWYAREHNLTDALDLLGQGGTVTWEQIRQIQAEEQKRRGAEVVMSEGDFNKMYSATAKDLALLEPSWDSLDRAKRHNLVLETMKQRRQAYKAQGIGPTAAGPISPFKERMMGGLTGVPIIPSEADQRMIQETPGVTVERKGAAVPAAKAAGLKRLPPERGDEMVKLFASEHQARGPVSRDEFEVWLNAKGFTADYAVEAGGTK